LDPNDAEALENRGNASAAVKRHAEALQFYERLFALDPGHPFVKGNLLHARMMCSEWNGFHALSASIRADLAAGLPAAEPFGYQGVAESEEDLLACARIFSTAEFPQAPAQSAPILSGHSGQITVGYLCGEFRQQATSILMCGVYEARNKRRFKLIAFDNGTGDGSDYRQRIEAAFDELIDISRLSDGDVADLIRAKGVDILVNLNGYFGAGRMGVFAQRPSPIQVNYLGFPGTLGAPYIDYLIGDEIVIPADSQAFYSEKIAYLPHSYQANDAKRPVAGDLMIRADFGLPAKGFVFCCFNNNYKITPATFSSWMRILHRVEGSCLWLMQDDALVAYNLRKAAKADCISGDRLVFAGHMPLEAHLSRHRLADLFLDTLPYNAHTTASDSLWAGLPVLTRTGSTFPGRVASSLLRALDLTELITASAQAYEDLAVQLAVEPAILTRIRGKLQANVHTQPLFDTALFTSHLEIAYLTMFERYRSGQPPGHFHVPA
ncbi:MAG: hypothetical protein ABIT82_05775, partial [Ramlibacter sp.]